MCMYIVCLLSFTRRGTGAFNHSNSVDAGDPDVAVEDGSAKYSLRDTDKRIRRKRNEGVYTNIVIV